MILANIIRTKIRDNKLIFKSGNTLFFLVIIGLVFLINIIFDLLINNIKIDYMNLFLSLILENLLLTIGFIIFFIIFWIDVVVCFDKSTNEFILKKRKLYNKTNEKRLYSDIVSIELVTLDLRLGSFELIQSNKGSYFGSKIYLIYVHFKNNESFLINSSIQKKRHINLLRNDRKKAEQIAKFLNKPLIERFEPNENEDFIYNIKLGKIYKNSKT